MINVPALLPQGTDLCTGEAWFSAKCLTHLSLKLPLMATAWPRYWMVKEITKLSFYE